MHLCDKCDEAMHKIGKPKGHKRNTVGRAAPAPIMCDEEDGQVASVHCAACGNINLCAKCDTDKHKVKARLGHERTAPVPPAMDGNPPAAAAALSQPASSGDYVRTLAKDTLANVPMSAHPSGLTAPPGPVEYDFHDADHNYHKSASEGSAGQVVLAAASGGVVSRCATSVVVLVVIV